VASVLGTSVTQQQLVPAVMRVYGQADFVVGLDVDQDDFDKFSVSGCVRARVCMCMRGWPRARARCWAACNAAVARQEPGAA
jgi:hypothetical protein